jgi:hypothetical protein
MVYNDTTMSTRKKANAWREEEGRRVKSKEWKRLLELRLVSFGTCIMARVSGEP